jgi:hypothetical protein
LGNLNLVEAVELLDTVSDFDFKDSEKKPNFTIYDKQKEGFVLCIKANLVTEEYRRHLGRITKLRNLRMHESDGFLTIS